MKTKPTQRFCIYGHDTDATGRYGNGSCSVCHRERQRTYRHTPPGHRPGAQPRVPSEPLRILAHNIENAGIQWSKTYHVDVKTGYRRGYDLFHFESLTLDSADRWCIVLGEHLSNVYPELYA